MKVSKLLTLDDNIVKKAKEMGLNISGECNEFLRKRIGQSIISKEEDKTCFNCENLEHGHESLKDLIWLYPNERWICSHCLKIETRKITIGAIF